MRRFQAYHLIAFLLFASLQVAGCDSGGDSPPVDDNDNDPGITYESLSELAGYPIGVAIQSGHLLDTRRTAVIEHVFSSITAEYEMKMSPIWTGPDAYNWTGADAIVAYGELNDIQIHGHALIWHSAVPSWVQNYSGNDSEFEQAVHDYILASVGRYKDQVVSWDVVNEAFEDNTGILRDNVFSQRMGHDYLARMFQYAREADPDALLFYNDYGTTWDNVKRQSVLDLVDDFQARGIPIDGVGLQMHVSYGFPNITDIQSTMDELVTRGMKVHLSEVDIRVNPDGDQFTLTAERSMLQKSRVVEIVNAFNSLPAANRFAITMWGLSDPDSWLINFWGQQDWPLLFNGGLNPKPAYDGFVEALK